jgi:hypothetical protein
LAGAFVKVNANASRLADMSIHKGDKFNASTAPVFWLSPLLSEMSGLINAIETGLSRRISGRDQAAGQE